MVGSTSRRRHRNSSWITGGGLGPRPLRWGSGGDPRTQPERLRDYFCSQGRRVKPLLWKLAEKPGFPSLGLVSGRLAQRARKRRRETSAFLKHILVCVSSWRGCVVGGRLQGQDRSGAGIVKRYRRSISNSRLFLLPRRYPAAQLLEDLLGLST